MIYWKQELLANNKKYEIILISSPSRLKNPILLRYLLNQATMFEKESAMRGKYVPS